MKSMDGLGIVSQDFSSTMINHLVERGYDEEDYLKVLGLPKAASLITRLLSFTTTEENKAAETVTVHPNFAVHVEDFIRGNIKEFTYP